MRGDYIHEIPPLLASFTMLRLSPQIQVRECRGVRRATPVDSSSLIFLKGTKDFNGTTADADASGKATAPPSTEERESTRSTSEEDERRGSGPEGDGMALGSEDVIQVSRTQAGDDAKAGHQASGAAGTRMGDAGGSGDTPDDWEELDDDDTCSLQEPSASRAPSYRCIQSSRISAHRDEQGRTAVRLGKALAIRCGTTRCTRREFPPWQLRQRVRYGITCQFAECYSRVLVLVLPLRCADLDRMRSVSSNQNTPHELRLFMIQVVQNLSRRVPEASVSSEHTADQAQNGAIGLSEHLIRSLTLAGLKKNF